MKLQQYVDLTDQEKEKVGLDKVEILKPLQRELQRVLNLIETTNDQVLMLIVYRMCQAHLLTIWDRMGFQNPAYPDIEDIEDTLH